MEISQYQPRSDAALVMATAGAAVTAAERTGKGVAALDVDSITLLALLTTILLSGYMVAVG